MQVFDLKGHILYVWSHRCNGCLIGSTECTEVGRGAAQSCLGSQEGSERGSAGTGVTSPTIQGGAVILGKDEQTKM